MPQQEGERLDSWKEIAAYLGRDLRTVRRWEKEKQLPVHRVPGGERRAVFAYRVQIDAWLENIDGDESASSSPEASPSVPIAVLSAPAGFQFGRTALLAALLAFACFAALGSYILRSRVTGPAIPPSGRPPVMDDSRPEISSVTPISPQARQRIVIQGRGLGLHVPYAHTDTPYLAIRDDTARWAAGRVVPHNWDEVMVEIAVWNPQNGVGPARYRVQVAQLPAGK